MNNTIEQRQYEGEGFVLSSSFILEQAELVTDFFGDNRDWYYKLQNGGSTYGKVSLHSAEAYDIDGKNPDENDLPPLDPAKITQERAETIRLFFKVYPAAKEAFMDYYNKQKSKEAI